MSTPGDTANRPRHSANCDDVVVGAGFVGLYMLHRLLKLDLRVTVFEAGTDVGGT